MQPLHVAIAVDQHPSTLGGMQTSVRLQRAHLERAGHLVSILAPAPRRGAAPADPHTIPQPSLPLGPGEYSALLPGRRSDRAADAFLAGRPPLDLVHVQADFWGALAGYRLAARHGVPVVHTMHNRLDVGIEATTPAPGLVVRALGLWQRAALRTGLPAATDAWAFLARYADRAAAVTAPSSHFARLLRERDVCPAVDVVSNGLDDEWAGRLRGTPRRPPGRRPRLVWTGRFSAEKRLLEFLDAVDASGTDAEVHVYGDGALRRRAEARAARIRPAEVRFHGSVAYPEMLAALRGADALVQTSIGFETQGMTVFEAAALGTPSVLCDHRIAADLPAGAAWLAPEPGTRDGLAAALRAAAADIAAGTGPTTAGYDPSGFLQSAKTREMLAVYGRALAAAPAARARP